MATARLAAGFYEFTHGWAGLATFYVLIAAFSLAGLIKARADVEQYLRWPLTSFFTLIAIGLILELVQWLMGPSPSDSPMGLPRVILSLTVIMAGGFCGGLYWGARGDARKSIHGRGALLIDGPDAKRHTRWLGRKDNEKVLTQLLLAGTPVPLEDESKHFKLVGTTGAGKSTAMRELLAGALARGDRAVITDPDGAFLSRFFNKARGDVILNPFDARSAVWDLFAEIKNPYDVDQMARAFIADRPNADPTWTSYGRTFFAAVMRQAMGAGIGTVAELSRLLTSASREELKILIEGTAAAPFLEEGNEKFFGSVRATTVDSTKSLEYICAQRGAPFSVRQWIKEGRGVLFLPYQADQIPALRSIISTWMRLAIFQTLSLGEGDARLWFAIDELDALGPIDGLSDALPRLRKFGGRCVLGFQSISQVSSTYGQGAAQAMVENCGTTLILRCSASENGGTSRFASRLIGEREVTRTTNSTNRSKGFAFLRQSHDTEGTSEHHSTEFAVMAPEIEQLPDRSGYLKFPSHPAWVRVDFPYLDLPKVAEPVVLSGETMGHP